MTTRVLHLSAYTDNLRARAFADGLRRVGWRVVDSRGRGKRSTAWEIAATIVPNCWMALRTDADLAVGCKPHPNVTWPLAICRRRGIPTWLDVDDLDHAYRPGWAGRVVASLQRPHPRRADVVTYHHARLRTHLVQRLGCDPERTLAVDQGVDVARFERDRSPLSALDGRPRAVLTVVGGGARLGEFRRTVAALGLAGSVELVGHVRAAEVPAYLSGADVAVTWSTDRAVNQHRCSLKLREYLAAGLPVVCNDVGELGDFAPVTYQVASEADLADELVGRLDGDSDGREVAGRALAAELDWQPIVSAAAAAMAARFGLDPPGEPGESGSRRPAAVEPQPVRLVRRSERAAAS